MEKCPDINQQIDLIINSKRVDIVALTKLQEDSCPYEVEAQEEKPWELVCKFIDGDFYARGDERMLKTKDKEVVFDSKRVSLFDINKK